MPQGLSSRIGSMVFKSFERKLFLGLRREATASQSKQEAVRGYAMHHVGTKLGIGCSNYVCVCGCMCMCALRQI